MDNAPEGKEEINGVGVKFNEIRKVDYRQYLVLD